MPPPRNPSPRPLHSTSTLTRPTTRVEATTALTAAAPPANQALATTAAIETTVATADTAIAIIRTDIDSNSLTTVAEDIDQPPYFIERRKGNQEKSRETTELCMYVDMFESGL